MESGLAEKVQMVLLDLDGTLLNDNKEIGDKDYASLITLGKEGIVRVFATGRNLFSANNVLQKKCPFDYLIFSSGAGILNWKTGEILFNSAIQSKEILKIEQKLKELELNFSIHLPIPENHKYFFHRANPLVSDFDFRNSLYKEFSFELNSHYPYESASQFLIILNDDVQMVKIFEEFDGLNIIRATSPIDGKSIWLEIFEPGISKASGGTFLCNLLNISPQKVVGIGNDYNDLEMLAWTAISFTVANAPGVIKCRFNQCVDNLSNPLTDVLNKLQSGQFI